MMGSSVCISGGAEQGAALGPRAHRPVAPRITGLLSRFSSRAREDTEPAPAVPHAGVTGVAKRAGDSARRARAPAQNAPAPGSGSPQLDRLAPAANHLTCLDVPDP